MDSIGSNQFIYVRGAIDPPGRKLADATEPNEDGAVYELEAIRASETELRTLANVASPAGGKSALAAYKALIGTVTTVTQLGSATTGVTVIDVQPDPVGLQQVVAALGGNGSGNNVLVRAVWRVRITRPN